MRYFIHLIILMLVTGGTLSEASENNAINLTGTYGLDSNPHHLSDNITINQEEYWKASLLLDSDYNEILFLKAVVNKSHYLSDERADSFDASAEVKVDSSFGFEDVDLAYELGYQYRTQDKTYVSQYTGFIGQYDGQSIADRYDFDETGYLVGLKYTPYKRLEIGLFYQSTEQVYLDSGIVGLTNLSNEKTIYQVGIEYTASKKGHFFLNGVYTETLYEERLSRELNTDFIPGSLLELEWYDVNIGYIYKPEEGIHWEYKYNYQNQRDSASGYYNGVQGFISMTGKYAINEFHHIYGTLGYYKFSFKNQDTLIVNPLEEDATERYGTDVKLSYEWIIATLFDTNLAGYADIGYSNFINKNVIFSYRQAYAGIGIRWSAF